MTSNRTVTRWLLPSISTFIAIAICYALVWKSPTRYGRHRLHDSASTSTPIVKPVSYYQGAAPSLKGGVAWINSGPITLQELRGKIVLLDFWTFCCINCHHILPDLAKLEEKYKNELVVIGVHTAKFDAEKDTENIRRKVHEYRIKHPVINDANQVIWRHFGVQSWPTLVLIDPNGKYLGSVSGEGHYDLLDEVIGKLVQQHREKGDLNLDPLKFSAEMERSSNGPLLFPGKVLADRKGKRLFISDTGHNRIIQTDIEGNNSVLIGDGEEGFVDGTFNKARFNRPQGLWLDGETLYVADTENHAIRAVDFKEQSVATIAGIGTQSPRIQTIPFSAPAKATALSSPWDLVQIPGERALYIAMAGPHQIWKLDLDSYTVGVFAGSGYENILDGPADSARFAQPSGITTDGVNLFVADSEVSGIREITGIAKKEPHVRTVVGMGLFEFGDHDGRGSAVRLQHCLGVAYGDGHLYIADTYNNKIKVCTPKTQSVKLLVGAHKPGQTDDPPHFYEPGGLSIAGTNLYVADTNNHKVRVVDLSTNKVKTLELAGLTPPRPLRRAPSFARARVMKVPALEVPAGDSIKIAVSLPLPKGYKFNAETPMDYLIETPNKPGTLSSKLAPEGERISPQVSHFEVTVPLSKTAAVGDTFDLRLSLQTFVCSEASSLCQIRSYVWNVPVSFVAQSAGDNVRLTTDMKEERRP